MSFYYLATPYSKYPEGLDAAFRVACEAAAILMKNGVPVYSPIAHTHPVSKHSDIDPLDHEFWLKADEPFMRSAKALIVLKADTWWDSHGVQHEMKHFRDSGKNIFYFDLDELDDKQRLSMLR